MNQIDTNNQKHQELIELYLFCDAQNSLSFRKRVAVDLRYTEISISTYSKELDALSDLELEKKLESIKAPWWMEAYEKYLRNNKELLLVSFWLPFIGKIFLWWKSRIKGNS